MRLGWILLATCLACLYSISAQPVAAPRVRFNGAPNDIATSGIRFDFEFNEDTQLTEERWRLGWAKRAGSDLAIPNTHLLVYLHSYTCRKYVSAFNRTCIDSLERKALYFPRVDHMSRLEINNSALPNLVFFLSAFPARSCFLCGPPNLISLLRNVGFNTYANDTELVVWLSVKNGTTSKLVFDSTTNTTTNTTVNTFVSTTKKHYTDPRGLYIVGAYTVFLTMNQGLPTNIEWEEGCDECFKWCGACRPSATLTPSQQATTTSSSGSAGADIDCGNSASSDGTVKPYDRDCNPGKCIDNMCAIPRQECANTTNCVNCDDQTCNLKVYVGWKGTDVYGRVLTSFGSVPSVFRKFSFSPSYRQAAGMFTKQETFLLVGG